ncbi:unnamed protein product [Timema podura]|uniref:Receptor protein-tyrosine kinase n=1 Tax=Timema podura TaxID=61482 RepID=A0ABN7NGL3_TIMPD|nr:unnamed protein product [Timema podura]
MQDVNTTYNNLVHNGNKSMTVYAGEEVNWVVKIIAHPKPNVTWYDQLINEMVRTALAGRGAKSLPSFRWMGSTSVETLDIGNEDQFGVWGPENPIEGDEVRLHCGGVVSNFSSDISWFRTDNNLTTRQTIINNTDLQAPYFKDTNMNKTKWYMDSRNTLHWKCNVGGTPKPDITWYKDDALFSKDTISEGGNESRIEWRDDNQTLVLKFLDENDDGTYKCRAKNKVAILEKTVTLTVKGGRLGGGVIAGISVLVIRILREMAVVGLIHFEEGAMDNMNPELPLDEQAELLPYDKKWEFPRDKLKLGKQLGAGAFGVVMKAEAWGIVEGETVRTVAVKMVKKNADYTYLKALASELKIMVHLGKHLNVNKKTGQIDSSIGSDILARAASLSAKTNRLKYASLYFSDNSGEINSGEDYRTSPGYLAPCSPGLTPNSPGIDSNMRLISMTPTVEDTIILSNNSSQPEWRSNVHGDYKLSHVRPICTRDLLCWAFQVARGMEYLAGRKVLHGDLAARNILLADDNIVKICDFGLAKSMYKSDNYKKKGDGPLPLKWMAVESIRDRIFSTQSDVWSFGIVLWEFFSLARTPYPGMEVNEKLYNKLVDGYRMECTDYATKEMQENTPIGPRDLVTQHGPRSLAVLYKVMLECWQARPTHRPSFTDLSETLGAMLEESVRNVSRLL